MILGTEVDHQADERLEPLHCDRWIASSILQKAIRRGHVELAQRAGLNLLQESPADIPRRFLVIGFEDIGAVSPDVLNEMRLTFTGPAWRDLGERERLISKIVSQLAALPKDRSTDFLISTAQHHPTCKEFHKRCRSMNAGEHREVLSDYSTPLANRGVAALCLMGLPSQPTRYPPTLAREALCEAYRDLGVPADFVETASLAARKSKEPITLLAPLIWLEINRSGGTSIIEQVTPETEIVDGMPLYAFDKHTRIGKEAIRELVATHTAFRDELVQRSRWQAAARMAAFYADAAPIARRLEWSHSRGLEALGTEADFFKAGVPLVAIQTLQAALAAALDTLNAIRKTLWLKARASGGTGQRASDNRPGGGPSANRCDEITSPHLLPS
jgi:hypothetical protein